MDDFKADKAVQHLAARGWQGVRARRLPGVVALTPLPYTPEALEDLQAAWDAGEDLSEPVVQAEGA